MYYLHQHLQQIYNLPRFAENESYNYFKNYPSRRTSWTAEPIDPSDTFLLNRYNSMSMGQTGNGKLFPTFLNPFYITRIFIYPLKTSENQRFSDVFRRYRNRPAVSNGLKRVNTCSKPTLETIKHSPLTFHQRFQC